MTEIVRVEIPRTPNLLTLAAMSCERQGQTLFDPRWLGVSRQPILGRQFEHLKVLK
jgi:hypothetical protein